MEPPTEFTAESVRDYILTRGGKVTNHELVKHFKPFLTDPVLKGELGDSFLVGVLGYSNYYVHCCYVIHGLGVKAWNIP